MGFGLEYPDFRAVIVIVEAGTLNWYVPFESETVDVPLELEIDTFANPLPAKSVAVPEIVERFGVRFKFIPEIVSATPKLSWTLVVEV